MRVLVLGGTGQIGQSVAARLDRQGAAVSVLCRSEKSSAFVEERGWEPLRGDITQPHRWLGSLGGFDGVLQLAATFGDDSAQTDSQLTDALLKGLSAGNKTRRLVYTGGIWLYGSSASPIREDMPYHPPRWWSWAGRHASRVRQTREVEGLVVHPANVVDRDDAVPPILLQEAEAFPRIRLPLPLSSTWPLVARDDIARLYSLILENGTPGEEYLGASDEGLPVLELALRAGRRFGRSEPPEKVVAADWEARYGPWASGYGLSQIVDSSKARSELGWRPTPLREPVGDGLDAGSDRGDPGGEAT